MSESPFRVITNDNPPAAKAQTKEEKERRLEVFMEIKGGTSMREEVFNTIATYTLYNKESRVALAELAELTRTLHESIGMEGDDLHNFVREHEAMIEICKDQLEAKYEFDGLPGLNREIFRSLLRCSKVEEYDESELVFQIVALQKIPSLLMLDLGSKIV